MASRYAQSRIVSRALNEPRNVIATIGTPDQKPQQKI
jgi:hypothetical protein